MIGVYAIALGAAEGLSGARGEPLRLIARDDFEVVCGDTPPELSAEALRAHEAAVRRIADAAQACLPARFGSAAADEASLVQAIAARKGELAEALRLVRGREQMTLRVYGTLPSFRAPGGPGTRYLHERRRAKALPELEPLRVALGDLVHAERVEAHAEPGLVASVYHLIDRVRSADYLRAVAAARIEPLRLSASGPWPAWSFAPELWP
ncbi:MAG TPA: GvpL/GvpF family gas vesicle protein [Myxococcales bacterium]|nr:GvpL/GvpF family gas vesicle protein [Myxococcales bacterium]